MRFTSTRGGVPPCDFPATLFAPPADGGLHMPEAWPQLTKDDLRTILGIKDYIELAFFIMRYFCDDVTKQALPGMLERAYSAAKFGVPVVPTVKLHDNVHLLRKSQGPTWAFKDMALQVLGELLDFWLERMDRFLTIVVATSGDTGAAVIEAMKERNRIRTVVLSPGIGNMSDVQKAMMYGVDSDRVFNIVLKGAYFDSAQAIVKALFSDRDFVARYNIGGANSIILARVLIQIVYYVWGWARIAQDVDQHVSFAIPTGNFGNTFAGSGARSMGVPIRQLIMATNSNDVLARFIASGVYDVRPDVQPTESPSMDIQVASNLERALFEALGHDSQRLRELMAFVAPGGQGWFSIGGTPAFDHFARAGFCAERCSDEETLHAIASCFKTAKIFIDPHTATAYSVGMRCREVNVPLIILETARWDKFTATVRRALPGLRIQVPQSCNQIAKRPLRFCELPPDVDVVKAHIRSVIPCAA